MYKKIGCILLLLITLASFWIFSRFTVDDAFITWRYGKNLVDQGIWNYNPSVEDLTLSYTNPIYALLSIIPHLLNIDVVLFFKVFSLIILSSFIIVARKYLKFDTITLLALLSIPPTFIHLFSGLSTFLFGSLLGCLLISYYLKSLKASTILTCLLILTRPEGWLLTGLTPFYFYLIGLEEKKQMSLLHIIPSKKLIGAFLLIATVMASMLIFNKQHFGDFLPNTYYVKKEATFSLKYFIFGTAIISPILLLILYNKKILFITVASFMSFVVYKYSNSALSMNYCERFIFHLFLPITVFITYFIKDQPLGNCVLNFNSLGRKLLFAFPTFYILTFGLFVSLIILSPSKLTHLSNEYPRVLSSYGSLGKRLAELSEKGNLRHVSIGSIGIAPYSSGLIVLDNYGLGSNHVVKKGIDSALDFYSPDMVCLMYKVDKNNERRLSTHANQEKMFKYVIDNDYIETGKMTYYKGLDIVFYTKPENVSDMKELEHLSSKQNGLPTYEYFLKHNIKNAPWFFWKS